MKYLIILFMVLTVSGCLMEGIKDAGDAVTEGVDNVVEAGKKAPKQAGDASNELEKDVKD